MKDKQQNPIIQFLNKYIDGINFILALALGIGLFVHHDYIFASAGFFLAGAALTYIIANALIGVQRELIDSQDVIIDEIIRVNEELAIKLVKVRSQKKTIKHEQSN